MKKTKKLIAAAMACVLALSLTACASEEAKSVTASINNIGVVTAESADYIAAARTAYDQLSAEDRAQVKNYELLQQAETALLTAQFDLRAAKIAENAASQCTTLQEICSWIGAAWDNAAVNCAPLNVTVDGKQMTQFVENSEWASTEDLYYFVVEVLGQDTADVLRVQTWAMHNTEPLPKTLEEVTLDRLADGFAKNRQLYELNKQQEELASSPALDTADLEQQREQLPERVAAVEQLLTALEQYRTAVQEFAGCSDVQQYREACDAALTDLHAALAEVTALQEATAAQ